MQEAARCAIAMIVSIGLAPDAEGNTLASATHRPGMSYTAFSGFTTDLLRSTPMRQVAI